MAAPAFPDPHGFCAKNDGRHRPTIRLGESTTQCAGAANRNIEEVRRESEAIQREIQNEIDAMSAQINRLNAERERGSNDAERFSKRLDDASLRKRNPELANIKALEEEATAILKNANTEEERQKVIQSSLNTLNEMTDTTARLTDAEKARNRVLEELFKLEQQGQPADEKGRELFRVDSEIDRLKQQREEVEDAKQNFESALQSAASEGAQNASVRDSDIDVLQRNRLSLQEDITREREKELDVIKRIGAELQKQIALEKNPESSRLYSPDETEAMALGGQTPTAESAAQATSSAATEAVNASRAASATLNTALGTAAEALQGLAATSAELSKSGTILPQVAVAITSLKDEQVKWTEKLNEFGSVVIAKFTETRDAIATHTANLSAQAKEIAAIKIAQAAKDGVADLRTGGY
jgi:DNA repair exonuclease SbcCD ATPase subunit